MKRFGKRSLSVLLVLVLVIGLLSSMLTVSAATNTATRHQLCTALSSQAKSYYTGQYTYDAMSALQGGNESCLNSMDSPLFQRLNQLMTSTMTNSVSYSSLTRYWPDTDNNILVYSDVKTSSSISREHVWPKSRASFHQQDGGCDIHHLRPEDSSVNSTRSNYTMGNVREVLSTFNTKTYNGKTVLWYDGNYTGNSCDGLVEVADNVKGDVARIFMYVYVRWEEGNLFEKDTTPKTASNDSGGNNGKKVIESLDTLLQWCENDPVDAWEMKRNDLCQDVQGNRNVFIDYPELTWLIFGQPIPNDMKTPSGEAADAEPPVQTPATVSYIVPEGVRCNGTTSSYVGSSITLPSVSGVPSDFSFYCWSLAPVADTTTSVSGYSAGKSYTLTQAQTTFYAVFYYKLDGQWHFTSTLEKVGGCKHDSTELRNAREATCTEDGYTGDTYCLDCGSKLKGGTVILATGHSYEDGKCVNCGEAGAEACAHENTELRNVTIGSCTKDGYTGDTYCADCGTKLKSGMTVMANGHKYVEGRCTKCGLYEFTAVTTGACYFDDFGDCVAPWYHTAVDFAVANGLMKGVGDGQFDPNGSMTRAMIVTVLYRQAGSPAVSAPADFTDVPQGLWYSDAIAWAQDEGIVNGVSETEFAPDQNVTREQIATILWRCSLSPELTADLGVFGDGNTVSGYAETAICWAVAKGILSGDGENLNPGKNATRAEFACMILRYLEGSYTCAN